MRNIIFVTVSVILLFTVSACQKNTSVSSAPTIAFKTTSGYKSADFNLQTYNTALVGVTCNETSTNDPLDKLVVYKTFNGSGGSYPFDEVDGLSSGSNATLFSKDYTITPAGNTGGTLTYTFYVYTKSGASASCVIDVTVI